MTLEEIKNLSDEELGRELATAAGFQIGTNAFIDFYAITNGDTKIWLALMNICEDLNAVARIERAVIQKFGKYEYGEAIIDVCGMSGSHLSGIASNGICEIATATARQRAEACLLALQEKNQ